MAALAPIPSASERMAMAVTNGVFSSIRAASVMFRIRCGDGGRLDDPKDSGSWTERSGRRFVLTRYGGPCWPVSSPRDSQNPRPLDGDRGFGWSGADFCYAME